jgi:hypothetical protein
MINRFALSIPVGRAPQDFVIPSRTDGEGPRRRSTASALPTYLRHVTRGLLRVMQSALVRSFRVLRQPELGMTRLFF